MAEEQKGSKKYDDIIELPHHVSTRHPQMSLHDRAAQFSPFAALTGHDAAIRETARLTEQRHAPGEDYAELLDQKLQQLRHSLGEAPKITVRYFEPDAHKAGGSYITVSGRLKKIDEQRRLLVLEGQTEIPVDQITGLDLNPEGL